MINVNMTDKAGVTLATAGKYCADNVKVTPSADILRKDEQAKTATPTTSTQDITPDAGKALSKVTVNPITAAIVGNLDAPSFAASIVAAVEGKGVTVPDGTLLDGMASLIESIQAGGGGTLGEFSVYTGSFTPTEDLDEYTIELGYKGAALPPVVEQFVVMRDAIRTEGGFSASNSLVYAIIMTNIKSAYSGGNQTKGFCGYNSNGSIKTIDSTTYATLSYNATASSGTPRTMTITSGSGHYFKLTAGCTYNWLALRRDT